MSRKAHAFIVFPVQFKHISMNLSCDCKKRELIGDNTRIMAMFRIMQSAIQSFRSNHTMHESRVHCRELPCLEKGQRIKVMTYNVQFMAGKDYVFFWDLPGFDGPDSRPSRQSITRTLSEVARVINDESPDIILLQEIDDGAKRTDFEDQMLLLKDLIAQEYRCYASAFYWRFPFVLHPKIWGSVGLKLVILSKYFISERKNIPLPKLTNGLANRLFGAKRILLEVELPVRGGNPVRVINTHLEAFVEGSNIMTRQIAQITRYVNELDSIGHNWIIGGDFNLLLPGQYDLLPKSQQGYYNPSTEIELLCNHYQITPSPEQFRKGTDAWFTYFPNDPSINNPDRTLDYLVNSKGIELLESHVRSEDTLNISDHLPVIADYLIN